MIKSPYFILLLFFLLIGCSQPATKDSSSKTSKDSLKCVGKKILRDSVFIPNEIAFKNPDGDKTLMRTTERKPSSQVKSSIEKPKSSDVNKPVVRTMGSDTFKLPNKTLVVDSPFIAAQNEPISALPMLMKDNATYNIQYLGVNQGMSSSNILSIMEDDLGNIWMGTKNEGLIRYNGTSFENYTEKEGLGSNKIWAIHQDQSGNIWFGTTNGITKYDGKYFTNYTKENGVEGNIIWSIYEDDEQKLWFGTNKGLLKYNGKYFVSYTTENGLSGNDVRVVYGDHGGNIWAGTFGHGVNLFNGASFINYTVENGLINNNVWTIIEDEAEQLWIGTVEGLSKLKDDKIVNYTTKNGLSGNYILSSYKDTYGNIWFGTFGGGVNKYDGKKFTHYTTNEGLSNDNIWSIIGDDSGNLWFGTEEGGINKFNQNSFVYYTEYNGMSNESVRSISEGDNGDLWFGTYGDGLFRYNGSTFKQYFDTSAKYPFNNYIVSILEDKQKNLWLGTFGGGAIKDKKEKNATNKRSFKVFSDSTGLVNTYVNTFLEDKAGNLWMGTNGGVSRYDGEIFTNYTKENGLSENKVLSIYEDGNGDMWFGTNGGGLDRFQEDTIINYTKENGLAGNIVNCILEDEKGNLWLGTNEGLSKYDGAHFSTISKKDGLSDNTIKSLIEDQFGNLWAGTSKGLNYIILNPPSPPQIIVFHKEEGLKSENFFINSVFLDSKDRIWWGNGGGLTMLDVNRFKFDNKVPQIQLDNIYLKQNYIDYSALKKDPTVNKGEFKKLKYNDVSDFNNYPIDLQLPYDINHITFNFSAIDWYAHNQIKYKYKLEGLDNEWSQLTSENKADYRNISYGHYTFKVKAIGSANKWSRTFEYPFEINPPWWFTWWAFTSYGLLLVLIVVLIVWLNGRRLIANAKELKLKVDDATIEIRKQRDEVEKQKEVAEQQKDLITENYKEITDSINYAERIQRSFLATKDLLDQHLNEYFIFFQPKAVVSGDFYWAKHLDDDHFVFVTADSTGHGVPGAIMSLLNITSIEKAIETESQPAQILNKTRKIIIDRLKNDGSSEGGKDGMDASLFILNKARTKLVYAAANNPIWIVRNGELIELKYDRMPIGRHTKDDKSFTQKEVEIQPNDMIYAITDGYPDQFGGPKGKKYKYKRLRELILSIADLPIEKQHEELSKELEKWKGDTEQVDDITVVGVKV